MSLSISAAVAGEWATRYRKWSRAHSNSISRRPGGGGQPLGTEAQCESGEGANLANVSTAALTQGFRKSDITVARRTADLH